MDAEDDQFNSEDQDMKVGEEESDCSSSADEESDLDQSDGGPDPTSEEVDQEAAQPCTSQVTQYQNKLRELDTEIKERMLELRSMMQSKGLNESVEILEESFSELCNEDKRKSKVSKGTKSNMKKDMQNKKGQMSGKEKGMINNNSNATLALSPELA